MAAVSAERYARQLAALLPPGLALAAEPGSELAQLLQQLGDMLATAAERGDQLQAEAAPATTLQLLAEWEAAFGLPDSCTAAMPTLAERREALIARQTDSGGARIPRFIKIAQALGYAAASTSRFAMHTCMTSCDAPIHDEAWRFAWTLNIPTSVAVTDGDCLSGCDEPLATWGNTTLECIMQRECPQPSTVFITYGDA